MFGSGSGSGSESQRRRESWEVDRGERGVERLPEDCSEFGCGGGQALRIPGLWGDQAVRTGA